MAKLTTAARKKMPKSEFGLPGVKGKRGKNSSGRGDYPMPDKAHARVAKSYASKEEHEGKLSKSDEARIDAKANKVLGKKPSAKKPTRAPKRSTAADFEDASLKGYAHTGYRHTSDDR